MSTSNVEQVLVGLKTAMINLGHAHEGTPLNFIQDTYIKYMLVRNCGQNPNVPSSLSTLGKDILDALSNIFPDNGTTDVGSYEFINFRDLKYTPASDIPAGCVLPIVLGNTREYLLARMDYDSWSEEDLGEIEEMGGIEALLSEEIDAPENAFFKNEGSVAFQNGVNIINYEESALINSTSIESLSLTFDSPRIRTMVCVPITTDHLSLYEYLLYDYMGYARGDDVYGDILLTDQYGREIGFTLVESNTLAVGNYVTVSLHTPPTVEGEELTISIGAPTPYLDLYGEFNPPSSPTFKLKVIHPLASS